MFAKGILIVLAIWLGLTAVYFLGYVCGRSDAFAEVTRLFGSWLNNELDTEDTTCWTKKR